MDSLNEGVQFQVSPFLSRYRVLWPGPLTEEVFLRFVRQITCGIPGFRTLARTLIPPPVDRKAALPIDVPLGSDAPQISPTSAEDYSLPTVVRISGRQKDRAVAPQASPLGQMTHKVATNGLTSFQ